MSEYKKYTRKGLSEMRSYIPGEDLNNIFVMRSYIPGEDLNNIFVTDVDTPEKGGMVARNPKNHEDQWYIAKQYFNDNLELAE